MATIRRVPTVEHNFQLVVTKVYDEGDQELLEDEDESELQSILFQLFSFCFFNTSGRGKDFSHQRRT